MRWEDLNGAGEGALADGAGVAVGDDRDAVEDLAFADGAQQLKVLRMGPDEGLRGAGGLAEVHAGGGDIVVVPDLLGEHAADGAVALVGADERLRIAASGELEVGALATQQGPAAALAVAEVRAAVFLLPVTVVVIASPGRAEGRCVLEAMIDDLERVDDERVVGTAHAVADKLEEALVDDLARIEVGDLVWAAVGDADEAWLDVGVVEGLALCWRPNAHVVALDAGQQHAVVGGGPLVEVSLDPVGVAFEEVAELACVMVSGEIRGAEQGADDDGEGGGGVAGVLLPSLLLGDGRVADKEAGGALDEGGDVEVAELAGLPQPPG